MGMDDKLSHTAQDAKGKGKEALGKATDDERMEGEGKADQAGAKLKKAGENLKDAAKNVFKD